MFKIVQKNLTNEERCKFFRVIQKYNAAGVTLAESVASYAENVENQKMQSLTQEILRDMRNGMEFSGALGKHGAKFLVAVFAVGNSGEIFLQSICKKISRASGTA